MPEQPNYPRIADHGLIGDLQTSALVATDGSVDWFCAPRFDSPSLFGALLDADKGGRFRIRPTGTDYETKQMYFPDTAILVTRFLTEEGVGEVADFMPISGAEATDRHRLVRMLRCVRGHMSFELELAPRFDYGRASHTVEVSEDGAVFRSLAGDFAVHIVRAAEDERLGHATEHDGDLTMSLSLQAGQIRGAVLETGASGPAQRVDVEEIRRLFDDTVAYWKAWVARSTYTGRWREEVIRSAITLKLMTYAPTGGLVAAPTMGLPEQVGGERNWDYRYTWIRDASFSVFSLLRLGYTDEAAALGRWLTDRVREHVGSDTGPLNIMYRVDGSSDLKEEVLQHWSGYRGSFPARVGNDAAGQLQLDIYGEAMDSISLADERGLQAAHTGWLAVTEMLNWLADNWDRPEEGIWETRGGRKDFTYGRLMSWVAFDRGLRLAARHGRPAPVDRWREARDAIYNQVMERGWNAERQAFVQQYEDRVLDSALLRMSREGFVAPKDPMWLSTLDAMRDELVTDSLVYRYDPSASPDGLRGSEGTFSLCTFMYAEALARSGRVEEGRLVFEKMLTYANHVGLYAEEIGLSGEQLGNFPQAFT
ncbi:glycoside hydrolase family 15 protein, partial [Oryzihumus sp.]|uniref:glycoside hydrolase family 15 protein n=1 Tax=Oryzihumus sp. TaxID=1968903 RepID=UPI002ED82196